MPQFSKKSLERLETCHPKLQKLMQEVIKHIDITVLEGHRGMDAQMKAYREGKSNAKWGQSLHNVTPSRAVDVAPYPLNWNDHKAFDAMGCFIKSTAKILGIDIVWGGDWKTLIDKPHFELGKGEK